MPDPVFLHQLDEIGSRGCGNPFCTHDHLETFALVPRCHPGRGVRVDYAADRPDLPCGAVLRVRGRRCLGPVRQGAEAFWANARDVAFWADICGVDPAQLQRAMQA